MSPFETWARRLATAVFSLALVALVAAAGQIPFGQPTGEAVVRLSLRTTAGRTEVCREPTAEELEQLPIHMRRDEICDTFVATYRLLARLDGEERVDVLVAPGGLKGDRPLIVDRHFRSAPGSALLEVIFEPVASEGTELPAALPRYELDRRVRLEADRVTLVRLAEEPARLEIYD